MTSNIVCSVKLNIVNVLDLIELIVIQYSSTHHILTHFPCFHNILPINFLSQILYQTTLVFDLLFHVLVYHKLRFHIVYHHILVLKLFLKILNHLLFHILSRLKLILNSILGFRGEILTI